MAIQETLVDDIDGTTEDVTTVPFSVDEHKYLIDLTPDNRVRLYEVLEPFMEAGRLQASNGHGKTPKATHRAGKGKRKPQASDPIQLAAIRDWARANNHHVSDRGRVPGPVMEAFEAAHKPPTEEPAQ